MLHSESSRPPAVLAIVATAAAALAKAAAAAIQSPELLACAVVAIEDLLAPLVAQVQALLGGAQHAQRLLQQT